MPAASSSVRRTCWTIQILSRTISDSTSAFSKLLRTGLPLLAHEAMLDHIEHTRHEILRILKSETEQVS